MIFIQVIKYRNYILVTENLHLIFLKYWVGHFFVKGVNKDDGDLSSNSAEQKVWTGFNCHFKLHIHIFQPSSFEQETPLLRDCLPSPRLISKSLVLRETCPNFQLFVKIPVRIVSYYILKFSLFLQWFHRSFCKVFAEK